MADLTNLTNVASRAQDAQYTAAIQNMTPQQRQQYFAQQRTRLFNQLTGERMNTFQKSYTDLLQNQNANNAYLFYMSRNRDLKDLGETMRSVNQRVVDAATYNKDLATRQYEINEWSYNNKLDTLFVFQLLFITLLLTAFLFYLQRLGFISMAFVGTLGGILLFVNILIIANRVQYTNKTRDNRYWNRRRFGTAPPEMPTPTPPVCPPS